jgi:hypothetical protein
LLNKRLITVSYIPAFGLGQPRSRGTLGKKKEKQGKTCVFLIQHLINLSKENYTYLSLKQQDSTIWDIEDASIISDVWKITKGLTKHQTHGHIATIYPKYTWCHNPEDHNVMYKVPILAV